MEPSERDLSNAVLAELKETRAQALAGAVDAVATRAVNLRLDLERAMARIAELEEMIRQGKPPDAPAG